MAVVSISRIQIRRGRKNQGSGLPQLASGELGWAVDEQELWIGNGSVAEGAPYVGNTKILSEHDDLFAYADSYTYRGDQSYITSGINANNPVVRTLQARLDDVVSVRSFGAAGDGSNQTAALQRAIDQLYLNPANLTEQSRVILILEPGTYTINSTIYLPPFATIRGAGIDKTVIIMTANLPAFQTVNGASTVGSYASDSISTTEIQARNIEFSGLTIQTQQSKQGILLQSCKDSIFKDIRLEGSWTIGDDSAALNTGIELNGLSTAVTSHSNQFSNIVISKYSSAIVSDKDIYNNIWKDCKFSNLNQGIAFGENTVLGSGGMLTGPLNNNISNSIFDTIGRNAIRVWAGNGNQSQDNRFYSTGYEGGTPLSAIVQHPVIQYDIVGNLSSNDWFERSSELGTNPTYFLNIPFSPEVSGLGIVDYNYPQTLNLTSYGEYSKFLKLPAETRSGYEINYMYKSNAVNACRSGKLLLVVDPENNTYNLSDEYEYTGDTSFERNLKFIAQNYDENDDTMVDTIAIMVLNSTSSDTATFVYTVKSKS